MIPFAPAAFAPGAARFGAMLALAVVAACGSSDDRPPPFPDPDLPLADASPDGEPYPTDRIGERKRSGTRPGDRMPNMTFRAYRSGRAGGLESVSLAEYFDPKQARHKVLHLQVAATWCAICSSELEATMSVVNELEARGIRFLEVIVSGAIVGQGPALAEVEAWIDRHGTTFPTGIDVAGRRLGAVGVNPAAMPHDILIDTRTMEILDSSVGAPVDVAKYVLEALRFVEENPPSY
ncbi:MAG: TlpA family protein disulfide reductase [Labilithrix sp.]|nr:TlpA family protein disulfide reductase [Labilithrix sp.]